MKTPVPVPAQSFGRIAAQTAKQVIIQRVREAERDSVFQTFKEKEGELVHGVVQRVIKGNAILNIGKAEAILPVREQLPREEFRVGDRVRAFILDVKKTSKGSQIVVSRTHPGFLKRLFDLEVPEIYEGIVEVKVAAREAGERAKIAVVSKDSNVDPVGACVGYRGARVQAIVRELQGEKIDIVPWREDPAAFVKAALAPADVQHVTADTETRTLKVLVADDQLSLAIGKRGQNARLAAKLVGWKVDIKSTSELQREAEATLTGLMGGEARPEAGPAARPRGRPGAVRGLARAWGRSWRRAWWPPGISASPRWRRPRSRRCRRSRASVRRAPSGSCRWRGRRSAVRPGPPGRTRAPRRRGGRRRRGGPGRRAGLAWRRLPTGRRTRGAPAWAAGPCGTKGAWSGSRWMRAAGWR